MPSQPQAGRGLAAAIVLDRAAQAAQRGLSAIVDQIVQAATVGEKSRLPVVEFRLRRSLEDLDTRAKDLDPKLRCLLCQLQTIRKLAVGADAVLAIRGQELDLVGKAERLICRKC